MAMKKKLSDKFYGVKPLKRGINEGYPDSCIIKHNKSMKWLPYATDFFYETMDAKRLDPGDRQLIFGIKAAPEKFTKYDFMYCTDGPAFVVHKRVVDKLTSMCPDDFQDFPVILKDITTEGNTFENRDYYLINILNLVDAIDRDKTLIVSSPTGIPMVKGRKVFRENCMNSHMLARDSLSKGSILFDPALAREFVKSKGIEFLSDREIPI